MALDGNGSRKMPPAGFKCAQMAPDDDSKIDALVPAEQHFNGFVLKSYIFLNGTKFCLADTRAPLIEILMKKR